MTASINTKYLTIFRHAKAQPLDGFARDFDRPLTARGTKDAHHMGKLLTKVTPAIDWVISSPAQRTRETADKVTKALNFTRPVIWQDAIYEAEAETLLNVLTEVPTEIVHVLIIGHNPGMEALISGLVAGAPNRLGIHMPTAGIAHITLEIFGWNKIRWGSGTLNSLVRPKYIRGK